MISATENKQSIDALTEKAWSINRSDPQKCKELSIHIMKEAEKISYSIGKTKAQAALGASLVWLSNYDEALTNLYQAREELKKVNDRKKEAEVVYHIFCSFYFLTDYDHAIEYAHQILELADENNDDTAKANAYNGIGTIYYTLGENKKSIESLSLGLIIAEKSTDKHLLARILDGLGTAYFQDGNLNEAIIYKEKSAIAARESGIKNVEAYAMNGLANIHFQLKKYDLAEQFYLQSIQLRKEVNFKPGVTESLASLGKLYLAVGKKEEAFSNLQEALTIAKEIDSKEFLYKIYESLSEYFAAQNKIEEFKKHYELFFQNKEKHTNEKHRQTLKSKEMKLKMTQVENEKELLEKKHKELENYSRDLELLSSIGRKITSQISVEKINTTVHEILQTMMDATGFGIGVVINDGKNLAFPGYIEEGVIFKNSLYDLSDENRMATFCYNHQKEIFIRDFALESQLYVKKNSAPVIGKSVQSLIYLPLLSENGKVGVITVQSFDKNAYTEYHLNLLRNLAVYCAIALENASSYEKLEEMVKERTKAVTYSYETTKQLNNLGQELTSLNKFEDIFQKLFKSVSQLMDAGCFGVRIYIPEKEIIEYRFEMEKGVMDKDVFTVPMSNDNNYSVWCVKNKESIFINDNILEHKKWVKEIHVVFGEMPHSLLFQPMMMGEKIIGVITVQSFLRNAYQSHHLDILKTLANYTAIAIENANFIERLEEKVKERTEEILLQNEKVEKAALITKKISEIGKEIGKSLSIESIVATVYKNIDQMMDTGAFGIGIYREEHNDLFHIGVMENGKKLPDFTFSIDEEKIASVCFNDGKEILINDFDSEHSKFIKKTYSAIAGESPVSMIYIPLFSGTKKMGTLSVQSFNANAYSEYHLDILRSLAVYIGSALENASLYRNMESRVIERTSEIEKAYQDTKLLGQISKDISSSLSVETIIEKVYHSVNQLMDATGFGIGIYNSTTHKIKMPGYIEKGDKLEDFYYDVNDDRLATWCFKNKKEIFINDYSIDYKKFIKGLKAPVAGKDSASIIYLPLYLKEEVMGILTIQSFEKNVYTEYHMDILRSLATSIATALDNARLYENMESKVRERTSELMLQKDQVEKTFANTKLISEIGKEISALLSVNDIIAKLYDSVNNLIDATIFGVAVYRPIENDLFFSGAMEKAQLLPDFSYPLTEDKVSTICFEQKREIIINDWMNEHKQFVKKTYNAVQGEMPESMIYLPLISKNHVIGVITVQSFTKEAYQDYHVDILRSLSVYVGSAIENANLYKSLEIKVKERTAEIEKAYQDTKLLGQISKDISSSLSVETIIEKVYHSVNKLMDATGFGIGIYNRLTHQIRMPGYIEKGDKLEDFYYDVNDDRLATWCFKNKQEIFINDYSIDYKKYIKGMKAPVAGKDSASIIYLPLYLKEEVMGILTIQSFEKNVYSEYHMDILRSLANSIASALDNAQLYENMEEKVRDRTVEVVKQKEIIEEKNKHITDSIIYAKRIQQAILPPEEVFITHLKNSFVLYKPKDIVSGDFYWIERKGNKILFAVVDCTGHGVPGAFMSIIGYNGLNQIVNEYNISKPSEILNELNKIISHTLKQREDESKIRDGMDLSICCIDLENNTLEYAGANNPIFIVRNNKVLEIKADKHPIGNFVGETEFKFANKELKLFNDDRIYLFSDGYADQFGGPRGKKLKYNQFRDLLLLHHSKPMKIQKEILDFMFEEWRGDLEQIDDVCVIGLKVG